MSCTSTHKLTKLIKANIDSSSVSYNKDVISSIKDEIIKEISLKSDIKITDVEFVKDTVSGIKGIGIDTVRRVVFKPSIHTIEYQSSAKQKTDSTHQISNNSKVKYDSTHTQKTVINQTKKVDKTHYPFWIYIVGIIIILIIIFSILKRFKIL